MLNVHLNLDFGLIFPLFFTTNVFSVDVIVNTTYGSLRGFQIQFNNNNGHDDETNDMAVNVFLGIPFSQPPIGVRRFEVLFHFRIVSKQ